jgi:hypothetical protein
VHEEGKGVRGEGSVRTGARVCNKEEAAREARVRSPCGCSTAEERGNMRRKSAAKELEEEAGVAREGGEQEGVGAA